MRLSRDTYDALREHAVLSVPAECCGVLVGYGEQVEAVLPADNVAEDPRVRFLIGEADKTSAETQAREHGYSILAVYHSHPLGPALPSREDVKLAERMPGIDHVIIGLGEGLVMRAFRMSRGHVEPLTLEVS